MLARAPMPAAAARVLDDGTALYDPRVSVEYLDTMCPASRLIPETGRQRIAVKRREALADGVNNAALAIASARRMARRPSDSRLAERLAKRPSFQDTAPPAA